MDYKVCLILFDNPPMLTVHNLHAHYGHSHVLHGVDFTVQPGEIVALLGRNGAGRSTTAKALMGLASATGTATWCGHELLGRTPDAIARLGLGYVPEQRDVFPRLTVAHNLLLGQKRRVVVDDDHASPWRRLLIPLRSRGGWGGRWSQDDMYRLFPPLRARQHTPAGVLSGGEQQMLTLCRTLMGDPQLILIDEPTEGLAPQMVQAVADFLRQLQASGIAVLLIEQKLTIALAVADRVLVMGQGRIVFEGTPAALRANAAIRQEWLEI